MRDALKNYLALASGLTEVTKQQAKNAAKALVKQGDATRNQVDKLADDLLATSKANRAVVVSIVRSEVDRALSKLGLATADEVAKLTRRLQDLEGALRSAADDEGATGAPAATVTAEPSTARAAKATTGKAPARKAAKPAGGTAAAGGAGTGNGAPAGPAKPAKPAKPGKAAAGKPAQKRGGAS